jgi:hypothetical protein
MNSSDANLSSASYPKQEFFMEWTLQIQRSVFGFGDCNEINHVTEHITQNVPAICEITGRRYSSTLPMPMAAMLEVKSDWPMCNI